MPDSTQSVGFNDVPVGNWYVEQELLTDNWRVNVRTGESTVDILAVLQPDQELMALSVVGAHNTMRASIEAKLDRIILQSGTLLNQVREFRAELVEVPTTTPGLLAITALRERALELTAERDRWFTELHTERTLHSGTKSLLIASEKRVNALREGVGKVGDTLETERAAHAETRHRAAELVDGAIDVLVHSADTFSARRDGSSTVELDDALDLIASIRSVIGDLRSAALVDAQPANDAGAGEGE
jgi:hypothetical protein